MTSTSIDFSQYFYYDESSPSCLRRGTDCRCGKNHNVLKHKIGDAAGTDSSSTGYFSVTAEGEQHLAHRVVWTLFNGEIQKGFNIDHINGDKKDNRISNLRAVTHAVNSRNSKMAITNSSGVSGVNLKVNTRKNGGTNKYWVSSWHTTEGERKEKNFSVTKYGEDEAFRLACKYRSAMIEQLNAQGAGYTDTHGKRNSQT